MVDMKAGFERTGAVEALTRLPRVEGLYVREIERARSPASPPARAQRPDAKLLSVLLVPLARVLSDSFRVLFSTFPSAALIDVATLLEEHRILETSRLASLASNLFAVVRRTVLLPRLACTLSTVGEESSSACLLVGRFDEVLSIERENTFAPRALFPTVDDRVLRLPRHSMGNYAS